MTLNLIETLKTSIYNPKHTKNTQTPFHFSKVSKHTKIHIFPKDIFKTSALYGDSYSIIYILCWGPHSLTSFWGGALGAMVPSCHSGAVVIWQPVSVRSSPMSRLRSTLFVAVAVPLERSSSKRRSAYDLRQSAPSTVGPEKEVRREGRSH